jgi:cytochrome c553
MSVIWSGENGIRGLAGVGVALVASTALGTWLSGCQSRSVRTDDVTASVDRGGHIYQRHCVGCHALHGSGDSFLGIPALAGQQFEYLRRQIELFSSDERQSSHMRWAFDQLSMEAPQAATDVAAYLSGLPVNKSPDADTRFQAEGRAMFMTTCAACHGFRGEGNPVGAIPSLRAQHDSYLVNRLRQLGSAAPQDTSAHAQNDHAIIAVSAYLSSLEGGKP